jgi:ferredoxin--NADP+ reductase
VIGSGPAGVYAAAALTERDEVSVDVIDRLPTPFGLVRYGVAPDHEKMKSVAVALRKVLEHERVRFLGNVELGRDVSLDDLHRHYDTLIVASGTAVDRRLGIERKEAAARWRGRLGDRGVREDRHTQRRHLDRGAVLGTHRRSVG